MKRSSPMKPGAPLKRTGFASSSTGILRVQAQARKAPARKAAMKTKQRAVTADEKLLWNRLAALGCIACMKDGHFNPHVSIHHVGGRTVPGCHKNVLPLCGPHHQTGGPGVAIHPYKTRWEAIYGRQSDLVIEVMKLLGVSDAI